MLSFHFCFQLIVWNSEFNQCKRWNTKLKNNCQTRHFEPANNYQRYIVLHSGTIAWFHGARETGTTGFLRTAEIFFGITFWRSLDTRLNWVTKPSDDLFTVLYSPPPTGWSAIGWGQGREHFCYLREKKQMGSYLLTLFLVSSALARRHLWKSAKNFWCLVL